ncbi:MAG: hypothetical protein GX607_08705 [Myxococcales bacterium]|nr:hypothetical protein [Myxococcales bacterium]
MAPVSNASSRWVSRWSWLRPLPWLFAAACLGHGTRGKASGVAPEGIELSELRWLDPAPRGLAAAWARPRALVVAAPAGRPTDVYLTSGRFDPGGQLLELAPLRNLTKTPGAAEHALQIRGRRAAWLIAAQEGITGATSVTFEPPASPARVLRCWVFEASGCPAPAHQRDWTRLQRWQQRIETWQELGSPELIERRTLRLASPARVLRVNLDDVGERGPGWETETSGRPGDVTTWLAERLRESPLGEQGVALLKAVGFAGRDYARRAATALFDEEPTGGLALELGELVHHPVAAAVRGTIESWPPAPLGPPLGSAAPNEGVWLSLDDDPFVPRTPEGHAPFLFTYLRPDAKRPHVRVHVILWDPRRVELHAVGGTEEPRSDRGERGTGRIPRDPKVLERLAGAFNGAFRTRHGEFGMAADDTLYIPPKPYGATIATLDDGSTALGTWPDAPGLPPPLRSFRQNMTPLLQDERANPYRRHWWGGTPEGWRHESFTVRTALCLTRDGMLAYLYGDFLDPNSLIAAGQALRCDYAVHLDMNAGHTGFELYHVAPAGRLPTPDLDPVWQTRGAVPDAPGYEFLARRMSRHMPLMNFPRYIHREQRDFFYLTLRPSLGRRPLPRSWRPSGPVNGWTLGAPGPGGAPSPWAHASARPFPSHPQLGVHLVALDPTRLRPGLPGQPLTEDSLSHAGAPLLSPPRAAPPRSASQRFATLESSGRGAPVSPQDEDAVSLWWTPRRFEVARHGSTEARPIASLIPVERDEDVAVGLVGIDPDGFLVYAELDGGHGLRRAQLLALAEPLALEPALTLGERLRWSFGDVEVPAMHDAHRAQVAPASPSAAGSPRASGSPRLRVDLWAVEGPRAARLFPETPVTPPGVWAYRQLTHLPVGTEAPPPPVGRPTDRSPVDR